VRQNNNIMDISSSSNSATKVELWPSGIIYVERGSPQTEQTLRAAFERTSKLAAGLRQRGMPVLILNHAHDTTVSEQVMAMLQHLDFDKVAVYGTPKQLNRRRNLMARANGLDVKLASFETEETALAWLRRRSMPSPGPVVIPN
jgi:hypothetical protein